MWTKCILVGSAACAFVAMTACTIDEDYGKTEHETKTVDVGKAESVRAEIDMGVGQLNIKGDASKLLEADFTYNRRDWKPDVTYNGNSFRGLLTIRQGDHGGGGVHLGGNNEYEWDLRFNDNIPLDIRVNCGAGEGNLDLQRLTIRDLDVNMGVGRVEAELPPEPKRDYDVRIHGGIGEAVLHLPSKVGVVADASGGIGGIQVEGLQKRGGRWVNDIYEKGASPVTVHVQVQGGIGQIRLLAGGA
ncbi:MAG TPA: toast rack family protein [Bryobacteraceae bacterium]|nr:toast rack family protein [Bryobacteraceae bacterium]